MKSAKRNKTKRDRMFVNLHKKMFKIANHLYCLINPIIKFKIYKLCKIEVKNSHTYTLFFGRITKPTEKGKKKNFIWFLVLSWFCIFSFLSLTYTLLGYYYINSQKFVCMRVRDWRSDCFFSSFNFQYLKLTLFRVSYW